MATHSPEKTVGSETALLVAPQPVPVAATHVGAVSEIPRVYCIDSHVWAGSMDAVLGLADGLRRIEPLASRLDRLGWRTAR